MEEEEEEEEASHRSGETHDHHVGNDRDDHDQEKRLTASRLGPEPPRCSYAHRFAIKDSACEKYDRLLVGHMFR